MARSCPPLLPEAPASFPDHLYTPPYPVLEEHDLWRELRLLAKPQSAVFDAPQGWKAHSVNFQPSPKVKTQDRYVVTQLDIHGRMWTLTGVFDGHLGDVTVDHVAHHLPIIIRDFLRTAPAHTLTPALIAELFSRSIVAFDDAIARDVLDLFGGSIETLQGYSDAQIRGIINDQHAGGANWKKARLCMYGTTALVALVDPGHENLWVANLGDCQAIMVYPMDAAASDWHVDVLTTSHNGDNDAELDRVRRAHPGEPECVLDRRVLGALAPTRCLGDTPFKQPPAFTRRILYNLFPGFHNTTPWEAFLVRNQTPPYITAEPEVVHLPLPARSPHHHAFGPRYLILASDGFTDLCEPEGQQRILRSWAARMHTDPPMSPIDAGPDARGDNMALRLLRRALGGDDRASVSRVIGEDGEGGRVDDTAIVVQTL